MSDLDINFEASSLRDIAQAFHARKKALKHKSQNFVVQRQHEIDPSGKYGETLLIELALHRSASSPKLQVKIWPDRWVSGVAYQRASAGENWTSEFDGRMSAELSPLQFESSIEVFWDGVSVGMYRSNRDAAAYWRKKLIHGPIGLVRDSR